MMGARTLPGANDLSRLLSDLLGRSVSATPAPATVDLSDSGLLVAVYADQEGHASALCACTVSAAASLGAALTMVPPGQVDELVKANRLDGMVLENAHEVCNVLVQLLNTPSCPSLALAGVYLGLPAELADLTEHFQTAESQAFAISVEGYTDGVLTMVAPRESLPRDVPEDSGKPAKRILVAEDDQTSTLILKRFLVDGGHDVVTVPNGMVALEALKKETYDTIFVDWMMPELDGIGLIREARKVLTPMPTIIFCTAMDSETARAYAMEVGADEYLTKPLTQAEVLSAVDKCSLPPAPETPAATPAQHPVGSQG